MNYWLGSFTTKISSISVLPDVVVKDCSCVVVWREWWQNKIRTTINQNKIYKNCYILQTETFRVFFSLLKKKPFATLCTSGKVFSWTNENKEDTRAIIQNEMENFHFFQPSLRKCLVCYNTPLDFFMKIPEMYDKHALDFQIRKIQCFKIK